VNGRRVGQIEIDELVVYGKRVERSVVAAAIERAVGRVAPAFGDRVGNEAREAATAVEAAVARGPR
jgi:hypothetical protein